MNRTELSSAIETAIADNKTKELLAFQSIARWEYDRLCDMLGQELVLSLDLRLERKGSRTGNRYHFSVGSQNFEIAHIWEHKMLVGRKGHTWDNRHVEDVDTLVSALKKYRAESAVKEKENPSRKELLRVAAQFASRMTVDEAIAEAARLIEACDTFLLPAPEPEGLTYSMEEVASWSIDQEVIDDHLTD